MLMKRAGCVQTPDPTKNSLLEGHALCAIAYDDNDKTMLICNTSWNPILKGFFKMHYHYFFNPNLVSDLFTISID